MIDLQKRAALARSLFAAAMQDLCNPDPLAPWWAMLSWGGSRDRTCCRRWRDPAHLCYAPPVVLYTLPPTSTHDAMRVDEARLRRRLLTGQQEQDVRDALQKAFGLERASAMKWIDIAANSYVQMWTQLAALYAYTPRARGPSAAVLAAVQECGHWPRMVRTQRDVLALRECFVLISFDDATKTLQERVITPDFIHGCPRPMRVDPTRIAEISVWLRAGECWERHRYQIENEAGKPAPLHAVYDESDKLLREYAGDAYPFRDNAGQPLIPGVLYHAAETSALLDWETGGDVARGAVRLMVFYTGAGHVIVDASWQQRYAIDAEFHGAGQTVDGRTVIVADPATVLQVTSVEGKQAMLSSFAQPADPEAVMRTIAMYARQLSASAGVRSPEATRTESDIRSGYSLAVSREAVQEMQASYAPTFSRADRLYLHIAACLMDEPSLGPADWTVEYQALTLTPAEMKGRLDAIKAAREGGLMSRIDALLFLYPWLTVEEAQAKIDSGELDEETAEPEPANTDKEAA